MSSSGSIKRGLYEVAFDGQISLFQGLHHNEDTLGLVANLIKEMFCHLCCFLGAQTVLFCNSAKNQMEKLFV